MHLSKKISLASRSYTSALVKKTACDLREILLPNFRKSILFEFYIQFTKQRNNNLVRV